MADVFISFVEEERSVALALQRALEYEAAPCKVFLTADHEQRIAGENWLNRIEAELRAAKVVVVILSSYSLTRPWINFEAGAAWLNRAHLIPVCIGGLKPQDLPKPYNDFQAVNLREDNDVYVLIRSVAESVHAVPVMPPSVILTHDIIDALRVALDSVGSPTEVGRAVAPSQPLPPEARRILAAAVATPTGQITRYDLAQALVIQAGDLAFEAQMHEGKRRAELEQALLVLERLNLIEDTNGKRFVFSVTAGGYESASTVGSQ